MKTNKRILIADSGGTKTDWALLCGEGEPMFLKTQGINPIHQKKDEIEKSLNEELIDCFKNVDEINFYGAGCKGDYAQEICNSLKQCVAKNAVINIETDLMGAARALFQREKGIACILGTGANSCVYDGKNIVANTPALGYILGDEGSGAVLGKLFLNGIYKGTLSERLKNKFEEECKENITSIISKVYKQPLANRFLASICLFIKENTHEQDLNEMIINNFSLFFRNNLKPYNLKDMQVGVVGGMGFYFEQQLKDAAKQEGINLISIIKSPIHSLIHYHKM